MLVNFCLISGKGETLLASVNDHPDSRKPVQTGIEIPRSLRDRFKAICGRANTTISNEINQFFERSVETGQLPDFLDEASPKIEPDVSLCFRVPAELKDGFQKLCQTTTMKEELTSFIYRRTEELEDQFSTYSALE